jgi:anti-sigma B factor antagonist
MRRTRLPPLPQAGLVAEVDAAHGDPLHDDVGILAAKPISRIHERIRRVGPAMIDLPLDESVAPYDRRMDGLELLDDPSGVRLLVLEGEQDVASAGALRLALAGAREAHRAVVVELSIVSFIDSTILGVIMGGLRDCKNDGRGFAVVTSSSPDDQVPRLLGLTGMHAVFPVYESRASAVEHAAAGRNAPAGVSANTT